MRVLLVLSLLFVAVAGAPALAAPHGQDRVAVERSRRRNLREKSVRPEAIRTALRFVAKQLPVR